MNFLNKSRLNRDFCPIGKAAGIIGDKWIILILRECFFGFGRFEDFQNNLSVSRSVLAKKLSVMTDSGIIEKYSPNPERKRARNLYRLTEKGNDLLSLFVGLYEWGSKHQLSGIDSASYRLTAANSGGNAELKIIDARNRELSRKDLRITLNSKSFLSK